MIIAPFFLGMGVIMLIITLLFWGWSRHEQQEFSPEERVVITAQKRKNDYWIVLLLLVGVSVFVIIFAREFIRQMYR